MALSLLSMFIHHLHEGLFVRKQYYLVMGIKYRNSKLYALGFLKFIYLVSFFPCANSEGQGPAQPL